MSLIKQLVTEALKNLNSATYQPLKIIQFRDKNYPDEQYVISDSNDINDEMEKAIVNDRMSNSFSYLKEKLKRNIGLDIIAVDPEIEKNITEFTDLYTIGRILLANYIAIYYWIFQPETPEQIEFKDLLSKKLIPAYRNSEKMDIIPTIREVFKRNIQFKTDNNLIDNTKKTLQQHQQDVVNAQKPKRGRPKKNPEKQNKTFDTYR